MKLFSKTLFLTLFFCNLYAGTTHGGPIVLEHLQELPGDKNYLISGDIIFRKELAKSGSFTRRWPNGKVPYSFAPDVSVENVRRFTEGAQAISELVDKAVEFIPRTNEANYIEVQNLTDIPNFSGGISELGMTGGKQTIRINLWERFVIQHEILHALGFTHEQERPGRDQYVTIQWDNIAEDFKGNYTIYNSGQAHTEYDFVSIMHYRWDAFSINGQAAMIPAPGFEQFATNMGGSSLSDLDIEGIRKFYDFDANAEPTRWIPHLTSESGGFETILTFTNTRNLPEIIYLYFFDKEGNTLPHLSFELRKNEHLSTKASEYSLLHPGTAPSHMQISGSPYVKMTVAYRFDSDEGVTAHLQETKQSGKKFISYQSEWDKTWEGLAIVNIGDEPATIQGVRKNTDGTEAFRATIVEALAPKAKHLMVFDDFFGDNPEQQIQIESSQEAVVILLRGSRQGTKFLYQTDPLIVVE